MENLKEILRHRLLNAGRIAILGIGSAQRGDDAAGTAVALKLRGLEKKRGRGVRVFCGYDAPENLTGEIRRFNPTHIIIVDALVSGKTAGTISIVDPADIGGVSFSTHRFPINILIDYLKKTIGCEVLIIGIQPLNVAPMEKISGKVKKAVREIASAIRRAV